MKPLNANKVVALYLNSLNCSLVFGDTGCVSIQGRLPKHAHFKGIDVIMLRKVAFIRSRKNRITLQNNTLFFAEFKCALMYNWHILFLFLLV